MLSWRRRHTFIILGINQQLLLYICVVKIHTVEKYLNHWKIQKKRCIFAYRFCQTLSFIIHICNHGKHENWCNWVLSKWLKYFMHLTQTWQTIRMSAMLHNGSHSNVFGSNHLCNAQNLKNIQLIRITFCTRPYNLLFGYYPKRRLYG